MKKLWKNNRVVFVLVIILIICFIAICSVALTFFYSKDTNGMWQETVTTRTISAEQVPESIRRKLDATTKPIDISEELELELK